MSKVKWGLPHKGEKQTACHESLPYLHGLGFKPAIFNILHNVSHMQINIRGTLTKVKLLFEIWVADVDLHI